MNLHYSKTVLRYKGNALGFTTLWIYTTPKPQKRIFEVATSACITRLFNYILSYRHPFVKNILTTIFMEVCSTTLQFCTSSAPQRDNWSCYRRKSLANTLLQNYNIIVPFHSKFYYPMNLHYSKTLHRLLKQLLEFYYPMNLHYSKTLHFKSKQSFIGFTTLWIYTTPKPQKRIFEVATSACITRLFNYILSYRHPFVKNILTTIFMEVCSTTLQFCTSSAPQRDNWSCYRRKSLANTLLQNYDRVAAMYVSVLLPYEFTLLQNNRCQANKKNSRFTTLWIYTTPKPQKRTEAATSAYITRLFNYILSYHLPFVRSPYWLLYLCKFVQLPCDLVPLQMLK